MLSVAIATHNEAHNLERCLQAVKELADEVVIADGESTDETVALAKKLGAKVIQTTNKANFHINKQLAADATKGELVLHLDADEVVDKELAKFITKIHQLVLERKKTGSLVDPSQPVAWWVKRKNYFLGTFLRKGGQYPDPVIRLNIKDCARWPQQDVHEQMAVEGEVGWAEGHLLHYGNPTFADYLRKFNTYTSFKAGQLQTAKVPISLGTGVQYLLFKPMMTFLSLYLRHKGFIDGVPGFVFAWMSGCHHAIAYLKLWEMYETKHRA